MIVCEYFYMLSILLPTIDPVAFSVFNLAIYWYALAYVVAIVLGDILLRIYNKRHSCLPLAIHEDLMTYMILAIIIGGRLGYVVLYNWSYYQHHPLEILALRQGGMSFHGALIAGLFALYRLAQKYKVAYILLLDMLAMVVPIGLFLGRIANFINNELYGRETSVPWGFLHPDGTVRHASQLYEAGTEGFLLGAIMYYLSNKYPVGSGLFAGVFSLGYGISRFVTECFREPDAHIGYYLSYFTQGQLLSVPLIILGLILITQSKRQYK